MKNKITIGTRGSKLALWQAEWVKTALQKLNPDLSVDIKKIRTTGDKIIDVPLAQVGGKGLFVKEIEEALLRNEVDIAVHSMKDVPTDLPAGLHIAAICEREDPRDALIMADRNQKSKTSKDKNRTGGKKPCLMILPKSAVIGTSSLRRSCQLLNLRPDLNIVQLRGNLDTRLRKLDEGRFDAIILAAAGVKRLGWQHRITELLANEVSIPAIGQGAIGIECRIDSRFINNLIRPLNHPETAVCVRAERAFLKRLEGGCQIPVAALARLTAYNSARRHTTSHILIMDGFISSVSGDNIIRGNITGDPEDPESLGIRLADDILSRGGKEILNEIYRRNAIL